MANKTLLKAADILEKEGWVQEAYHNKEGYCAVGALNAACGFYTSRTVTAEAYEKYTKALECLIKYLGGVGVHNIIHYNDHVAKSAEEVISKMREAAETC